MSLSFLFSFLVVIACLCFRGTCPDAHLAALRYFWQTALAFLPGAKPTACTHRQPHQGLSLTSIKLTAGPLLRGIQSVLQELAGSATGGRGLGAGLVRLEGALHAWSARETVQSAAQHHWGTCNFDETPQDSNLSPWRKLRVL